MRLIVEAHKRTRGLIWVAGAAFLVAVFSHNPTPKPARAAAIRAPACVGDCASADAGYRWASKHGVVEAFECAGHSKAFEDGCLDFIDDAGELPDQPSRWD